MKRIIIYIVLLVLVIIGLIAIDAGRPRPVNWTKTFKLHEKKPFGLYVFNHEVEDIFKSDTIKKLPATPYEYFEPLYDYDTYKYSASGTFLNISGENTMDKESAQEVLFFVEHGNTAFISLEEFPQFLLDTLKIETRAKFYPDSLQFTINRKPANKLYFNQGLGGTYFSSVDTLTTTILGYQQKDTIKDANLIRVPFGNGQFILHTQPIAFTNYYLLKGTHMDYAQNLLSFIPKGNVHWYVGDTVNSDISDSPLRYILSQPALKWAYYLAWICLLIFMFFNARRKQRIVEEVAPLRNTTVDFTKTIGNLYYQEKNHHTIIEKKIIYFLEHIRNEYLIDTYSLDDAFIEKLHQKTGKPIEDIQKTVSLIKKHRHHFESTEADVIEINKAIENLRL